MIIIRYLKFWLRMVLFAARGGKLFYAWVGSLALVAAYGAYHYYDHVIEGLAVTNMSDQVSWGIGIANFVYFVGVAASAALIITPAYVFMRKDIKEVVLIAQVLAFVAVVLCLLFIVTDMGRPERLWHIMPLLGKLNLPGSLLAWDVVVFNGYLVLNLHIPGYLLWRRYNGVEPSPWAYLPFIFIAMGWAVSLHVVTAFLLGGLGSRHFWNTAILAPRFLITTGASGPAMLTLIFYAVRRLTPLAVKDSVFEYLRTVMQVTLPINFFLIGCEVFYEFYTGKLTSASAQYLYFGLHGYHGLTVIIWSAVAMNTVAMIILLSSRMKLLSWVHFLACGLTIFGIWIEKGMGLIFPGFTPTPLGEIVEYFPSMAEVAVNVGVLALGMLLFTLMAKVTIGILTGELRVPGSELPPPATEPLVTAEPPQEPEPAPAV